MNDKCLLDEFQQKVIEKLSNEIVSIIMKQVESAINNSKSLHIEKKTKKFDQKTLKPFDKVLVRDFLNEDWMGDFFEKILEHDIDYNVACVTCKWAQCIPYNEETKHLIGTNDDCPEYYKWWVD